MTGVQSVLFRSEGNQIVGRASGSKSYEQLVGLVEDRSEPVNLSEQMNLILENLEQDRAYASIGMMEELPDIVNLVAVPRRR